MRETESMNNEKLFTSILKWDERFIELARLVATWSKDPSTKTGAVIIDTKRRVVGIGFNGFPRGVKDSESRYQDRELKYKLVVHCEANAILNANGSVVGCTIYTTKMPCTECTKLIIQAGLLHVVIPWQDPYDESVKRWREDAAISKVMLQEARVVLHELPESDADKLKKLQAQLRELAAKPESTVKLRETKVDECPAFELGNCSSNECAIRQQCCYPTACCKIPER